MSRLNRVSEESIVTSTAFEPTMPFFSTRMPEHERGSRDVHHHVVSEQPAPVARNYLSEFRPRMLHPVQIPSATFGHRGPPSSANSRTSLLWESASSPPIPSYATIQQNVVAPDHGTGSPVSASKPPRYNPRWERLPGYRDAAGLPASGSVGSSANLGATPPVYWATYGAHGGILPIATGSGAMFFNSPFQHYRMLEETDVERIEARARDRICGMRASRADVVINLSLLTICILIWTAVGFSLSLAESRQGEGGNVPPRVVSPHSDQYDRPTADWALGMSESKVDR
ncbi:hypothetical protein QFC21_003679 [Naganishia friedmannii]|uniref:Uncharacterized protein n=1 Tax=Naganishia friedmannii TaxID=89922 RepID=A0ACC2VP20_9TREE|nr:hypothetical protein QFC21_003679 [Naganishia friedmannii]